ncbi:hypothetical protein I3271_18270 [Photobacterium leiognathi]|uniref:hypothetical protein n=1 Tax=Photobacterium leiognathi TaxID=553611 RepID=UPI001EE025E6|nr:hypothetical protein [Photobacterium leiognathi]MCG3886621.1 hypothetical protein [Photobacterium leiognathi]
MTKLFSLSAIALLTSLSTVATAASLDVHGDIKINGKTVIDAEGNVIQDQSHLINIDDYANAAANRVVTLVDPNLENGDTSTYKFYYDETGREYKEEISNNNTVIWSMEWKDRTTTPLANTSITIRTAINDDGNGNITTSSTRKVAKNIFSTSTGYPLASIGTQMTRADVFTHEILEHTDQTLVGKKTEESEYQKIVVLDRVSVKENGIEINDCILVQYESTWSAPHLRTYCKNYGLVALSKYKLQSVE